MTSIKYNGEEFAYTIDSKGTMINQRGVAIKTWKRGGRAGKYPCVALWKGGKRIVADVHRLVALHFVANPNPGMRTEVNHIDSDAENFCAENLEWVTRRENELWKRRCR